MRCFVAAWPDQATRVALATLSDDLRQQVEHRRATDIGNLHLTLAFIGVLNDDAAAPVAQAIAQLRFKPFGWRIDALGFFREAGVVWAGSAPARSRPLIALADSVRQVLDRMEVSYDRKPFAPHVTLFRGVGRFTSRPLAAPINWRVDTLALYRSTGGRSGSSYSRVLV